ncbi:MAG: acyl-CoA dehydrogenase family protein [Desulfomonilia bacterium]|jgi:alkylation response protein AidB-like acyl-CoA dehydrogenase
MPNIDDFIRPKEWVSDFVTDIGKVLREWGKDKYLPVRQKIDEDWTHHKIVKPLLKEVLVDLGINAAFFPYEVGGTDIPDACTLICVLGEEGARIDSGFTVACLCSVWPMLPIILKPHRNMKLLEELGPKFCSSELYVGCNAMTEPASGADIENIDRMQGKTIQTTAKLDGDEWVINGHKIWPTNSGDVANLYGVVCTTKKGSKDLNDFAFIYVPADTKGVSVGGPYQKAGMAADMNTDIWFDQVRVPKRYRAHGPGDDLKYFKEMITYGNMGTAAMCLGVMKGVYEIIKKWTTERIIAGKPLKEHSMVAAALSDIAINIEATSAWIHMYAREVDRPDIYGTNPWDDTLVHKTRGLSTFACKAVEKVCSTAMDYMGSYGYSREFDLEKHWRDGKMLGLWMGGLGLKQMENARYWYELETL